MVGANASNTAPHADSRNLVFHDGALIDVDDGGVYRLEAPDDDVSRKWTSLNGDLRITELYSVATDGTRILGGTQDNGVVFLTSIRPIPLFPISSWTTVLLGDGAIIQVDASRADPVYFWSGVQLWNFSRIRLDGVDDDGDGLVDFADQE